MHPNYPKNDPNLPLGPELEAEGRIYPNYPKNDPNLQIHPNNPNNMAKIIQKELSYKITGLCFQIQRELGRFCRERQYADRFEELLRENKMKFKREFELKNLNNNSPKGNRVDFLVEDKVIVDLKAKNFITKEDYIQMQRYLRGANLELGLIINFRSPYLKPKRVLNSDYKEALN